MPRTEHVIEVWAETCCEECNEVLHTHFDCCPVCKTKMASTTKYGEEIFSNENLECGECGAKFKLLSNHWYGDEIKVKLLGGK